MKSERQHFFMATTPSEKDSNMSQRPITAGMLTMQMLVCATLQAGDNWSSFHNGGNTSVDRGSLPLRWTPDDGIAWSARLPGYGQSAPVVWNSRLYLTAVEGDDKESNILLACDTRTGEPLWTRSTAATVTVKNSYMVSRAAPTPLVDSGGVYVLFESGDLRAFSHDGQPVWQRALFDGKDRAFQNGHGYGASPAQTQEAVIVLVDHRGPSYLMAVSKKTGDTLWKTERSSRSSWTSPHVVQIGNRTQVVVSSSGTVDGYDADTGEALWSHTGVSGNLIPSASVAGDRVLVGAAVSRTDPDARSATASNCCLQITPDSAAGFRLLWKADKAVCDYTSPLVHHGHVYYINKVGVVYCLDAATGQQRYAHRIGHPCWAQPIASGDRVYFFGKDGVTTVIAAGPEFEALATSHLWHPDTPPRPTRSFDYEPQSEKDTRPRNAALEYLDPIVYAAVVVDDSFVIRLGTHLFRVDGGGGIEKGVRTFPPFHPQTNALAASSSAADRKRLDVYFESVRNAEKDLAAAEAWLKKSKPSVKPSHRRTSLARPTTSAGPDTDCSTEKDRERAHQLLRRSARSAEEQDRARRLAARQYVGAVRQQSGQRQRSRPQKQSGPAGRRTIQTRALHRTRQGQQHAALQPGDSLVPGLEDG